jgi:hypothetical protein
MSAKLPTYFRAWRGSLNWSNIREATRLAKRSTEMQEILIKRVQV